MTLEALKDLADNAKLLGNDEIVIGSFEEWSAAHHLQAPLTMKRTEHSLLRSWFYFWGIRFVRDRSSRWDNHVLCMDAAGMI